MVVPLCCLGRFISLWNFDLNHIEKNIWIQITRIPPGPPLSGGILGLGLLLNHVPCLNYTQSTNDLTWEDETGLLVTRVLLVMMVCGERSGCSIYLRSETITHNNQKRLLQCYSNDFLKNLMNPLLSKQVVFKKEPVYMVCSLLTYLHDISNSNQY